MKPRYWSLAIVLILINYIIFATLITWLVETDFTRSYATRVPRPTFTPAPAQPFVIVATPTPAPPQPTPTATLVMSNSEASAPTEAALANPPQPAAQQSSQAQLVAPGSVNIRSGPGVDYDIIGTLNANTTMPIIGRNLDSSWWQIKITDGTTGWVSNSVVSASNVANVPLADELSQNQSRPLKVQPAAEILPPSQPRPQFQFEPAGWWSETNPNVTRFMGQIKDIDGSAFNGISVQASCGDYTIISDPSGPVSQAAFTERYNWTDGFYEITIDSKPVPCLWTLTVVETIDGKTATAKLSDDIPVRVSNDASVIIANWQQN